MIVNEPEIGAYAIKVVPKLWGVEYWVVNEPHYCLKFLKVIPGFQSSIHAHKKKSETFIGISGSVALDFHDPANKQRSGGVAIGPGDQFHISPTRFHSFQANNVSWIMEVSTHHDDKDVVRIQESRKLEP